MSIRKTIVTLTLVSAAIPAAFANNGTTWTGEQQGFEMHNTPSTKSRTEVQQELQAFRKNPVTAEGDKIVNTEIGFISPKHSYAFQGGTLVHTDSLAHDTPKPSLAMTDAEKRLQRGLYRH